jgi:CubicO group peptidase (beta-lactamase class C family)
MYAASFTKVAFAYMVMQLVDEGVLDLDKPVYQYLPKALPEYDDYKDLANDQRYQRITARMLLSHTSGFPNWRRLTDDGKLSINFEPGSRFAYSGEGIALLQLVVESATKKPLDALMRDRVFQPLGMTRSSMVWEDRFESDYANGYDEQEHSLGPQKLTRADAAGSMQTTLTDFGHFMEAVMQGKGLRQETREQMLSSQIPILSKHEFPTLSTETTGENKAIRLSYGLGWGLYWTPYGKAFFKEGHLEGWRHDVVCFDKPGTGIVIMTNSSKRRKPLQSTPRNLAQQYLHTDRVGRVHAIQFSEVRRPLPGLRDAKSGGNHCRRNRWRCNPSHEARKVPLPAETRLAVSGALQNPGFRSWCSFTTQTTKP